MSYFDPNIYNKQNLREADRRELDYWQSIIYNAIDNTVWEYENDTDTPTIASIKQEIVNDFAEALKYSVGLDLQETAVSIIDSYPEDEDVKPRTNPETYLYQAEE